MTTGRFIRSVRSIIRELLTKVNKLNIMDKPVPDNYRLTKENSANILVPISETSDNKAFINPIQEFNRDLSVAAIRVWSEIVRTEKSAKFKSKRKGKKNAEEVRGICLYDNADCNSHRTPIGSLNSAF